jgi:hypothetical protein
MDDPSVITLGDSDINYEQLLKSMGFVNDQEVKRALQLSKNDINEAVAILTNEKMPKITSLTSNEDNEIIMTESNSNSPLGSNNHNKQSNSDVKMIRFLFIRKKNFSKIFLQDKHERSFGVSVRLSATAGEQRFYRQLVYTV